MLGAIKRTGETTKKKCQTSLNDIIVCKDNRASLKIMGQNITF